MLKVSRRGVTIGAALAATGFATEAQAQQVVKIGAIYPLSGNSASAGNYAKKALELGAEIVNDGGLSAPVRTPRGRDIAAACGQLKSESVRAKGQKVVL